MDVSIAIRPTRDELQERLAFTEHILGRAYSFRHTQTLICTEFGVTPRTAARYVRAVRRRWAVLAREDPEAVRADLLGKLRIMYELAIERADSDVRYLRAAERLALRVAEACGAIGPAAEAEGRGPSSQNVVVMVAPGADGKVAMQQLTAAAREQKRRQLQEAWETPWPTNAPRSHEAPSTDTGR